RLHHAHLVPGPARARVDRGLHQPAGQLALAGRADDGARRDLHRDPAPAEAERRARRPRRTRAGADTHRGADMSLVRSRVRLVMLVAGVAVALVVGVLVSALGRSATFDPV